MSREQLIHEALSLSQREREMLAEELLVSVDRVSQQEIESLWKAEAERRLDAMLNGSSTPIDGPEFMKKLRQSRK
ncbi:MAG: addiction module protein [Candidatus Kapaibacterium sp.]